MPVGPAPKPRVLIDVDDDTDDDGDRDTSTDMPHIDRRQIDDAEDDADVDESISTSTSRAWSRSHEARVTSAPFTIFCFNVLAETLATNERHHYCPVRA
jgi:hypothetical protein